LKGVCVTTGPYGIGMAGVHKANKANKANKEKIDLEKALRCRIHD